MDNLSERIAWAIGTIKLDKDLDKGIRDVDLAKTLGADKNTLAKYRQQGGLIKGEVIEKLISHYHFSPEWFFKGIGEPFPGARAKYPDVCGPETAPIYNNDTLTPGSPEFKVSEDLTLAAQVLESGTPYATALHLNIRSFARAFQAEDRITNLETQVGDLRRQVNRLTAPPITVERREVG